MLAACRPASQPVAGCLARVAPTFPIRDKMEAVANGKLLAAPELVRCVAEVAPEGYSPGDFWAALASLVDTFGARNQVSCCANTRRATSVVLPPCHRLSLPYKLSPVLLASGASGHAQCNAGAT